MEISFHKTYSLVLKVIASGGLYFPGSHVIYPRFSLIIKILTYIMFVGAIANFVTEAVNQFLFMTSHKAEGMTDLFMSLSLGVASPTYVFIFYTNFKRRTMRRIVDIWEKEMTNPPYPEDRKAEIAENQRYLFRIAKAEVYGFIIPLAIWSGRTIYTKESILPIVYTGDVAVSPATEIISIFFFYFGYCLAAVWCATENIKLLFMKSILAELNHLYLAADKIITINVDEEAKPSEIAEELNRMRENLRSWIIYHQTVLKFSDEINRFIGPMILIQDLVAVLFSFADVFLILMGNVPLFNALSGMGYLLFYWYVMYVTYSLGDEIQMKSAHIFESFNGKEYYRLPKDIIKDIIFIQFIATHRPITLKATWYKSLSRKSLGELASKGYEIITFMGNLIKRNSI